MLSELSGLLLTSGIVLAASTFVAAYKPEVESLDEGETKSAKDAFNKAYVAMVNNSKKSDKLILAPSFGGSYIELGDALAKAGIALNASVNEQHATIDLQKLMKFGSPSFAEERKIQQALVEEGLLLLPGEAFGCSSPGQFRITAAHLTTHEVISIVDKIYKVAQKLKITLTKRSIVEVSPEDTDDKDDESVASSVTASTRKKRRT